MQRFWLGLLVACMVACSGSTDNTRVEPEICDDGIDNDEDGLIDCEDSSCGGLICRGGDDDDDTGPPPLPPLEIAFEEPCCSVQYLEEDCPAMRVNRFTVINRTEEDGEFDVSCDLVTEAAPIQWQIVGGNNRQAFVVNAPLYAGDQEDVEVYFVCAGVPEAFVTNCRAKAEAGEETLLIEFTTNVSRL